MRPENRRASHILIVLFLGATGYSIPSLFQDEFLDGILDFSRHVAWEDQGSPPSGALNFYSDSPLIRAENGNLYEYKTQDNVWVEVSVLEAEEFQDSRSSFWYIRVKKPKRAVDYYQGYLGYGVLYSVILRDGRVLSYIYQGDDLTANRHAIFTTLLIGLRIVCGITGLVAGLAIIIVYDRFQMRKLSKDKGQTELLRE
jgi:hypothetical protein